MPGLLLGAPRPIQRLGRQFGAVRVFFDIRHHDAFLSDGRLLLNRPFGVEIHISLGTIYAVQPQIIDSSLERSERSAVSL